MASGQLSNYIIGAVQENDMYSVYAKNDLAGFPSPPPLLINYIENRC